MRVLSTFEVTEDDPSARCAYCGSEFRVGDEVFDVYGDLYHVACWQVMSDNDWDYEDDDDEALVAGTA